LSRGTEAYFFSPGTKVRLATRGGSGYKGNAWSQLARDRRRARREYEELRLRIDALEAGDIRRRRWRHGTADNHAGAVQVLIGPSSRTPPQIGTMDSGDLLDLTVDVKLPALMYVCREKQQGCTHHGKAGAMTTLLRTSVALHHCRG
jgi:hypothetical protein